MPKHLTRAALRAAADDPTIDDAVMAALHAEREAWIKRNERVNPVAPLLVGRRHLRPLRPPRHRQRSGLDPAQS
jgi:hypothetical protein